MPKIDKNIVILLTSETSPALLEHDTGAIRIYATTVVQNNGLVSWHDEGALLSPGLTDSYGWGEPYSHLDNLRASALSNLDDSEHTIGWRIEYAEHRFIQLEEAEAMVKALRRTTREMDKLSKHLGSPATFGEYVTHFGLAIGCNRFACWSDKLLPNGTHYRWYDVDGMRRWVYNAHASKAQER
ncbi:hypothetical protein [Nonomuraea sp. SYSU D8015]|uniref:hypothetical protein n=1 Tax=Nonomuraea sp. SYSU D8015 TaxID=2593644 RepID=UPI00166157A4|nr:hypothetical protein [Nonomuraea sp. SYSU D8015]